MTCPSSCATQVTCAPAPASVSRNASPAAKARSLSTRPCATRTGRFAHAGEVRLPLVERETRGGEEGECGERAVTAEREVAGEHSPLREAHQRHRPASPHRRRALEQRLQLAARDLEAGGMLARQVARSARQRRRAPLLVDRPPPEAPRRRGDGPLRHHEARVHAERVRERGKVLGTHVVTVEEDDGAGGSPFGLDHQRTQSRQLQLPLGHRYARQSARETRVGVTQLSG